MFIFTTPLATAVAISSGVEPLPPWKTRSRASRRCRSARDARLDLAEQLGAQLHVAGLVHAVHVAEREGGDVAAVLAEAERLDESGHVGGGRVERLVGALVLDAVLLAADDADLDLEDRVDRLHAGSSSLRSRCSRRAARPSRPTCATGRWGCDRRGPLPRMPR
jgi:hypothetical protein